jgi:hypothetical protein
MIPIPDSFSPINFHRAQHARAVVASLPHPVTRRGNRREAINFNHNCETAGCGFIRVGDWGGYMLMECDDPLEVHKFCLMLPAFTFEARLVVPVTIRVELEAIAYRDGLTSK